MKYTLVSNKNSNISVRNRKACSFYIIIFFIILFGKQSPAQIKDDIGYSFDNGIALLKSPANYSSSDWYKVGSAVALIAGCYALDNDSKNLASRNQVALNNQIFSIDKYSVQAEAALVAGTYLYGLISEDEKIHKAGVDLVQAAIFTTIITQTLKISIGRGRPYAYNDKFHFLPFSLDNDNNSFPSGHTSFAFCVSTVMAAQWENTYWKSAWYLSAGLIGVARVYNNQHYLSDVAAGAIMGYYIGDFVVKKRNSEKDNGQSFRIEPTFSGIALKYNF